MPQTFQRTPSPLVPYLLRLSGTKNAEINDDQMAPHGRILKLPAYPALGTIRYIRFNGEMTMRACR